MLWSCLRSSWVHTSRACISRTSLHRPPAFKFSTRSFSHAPRRLSQNQPPVIPGFREEVVRSNQIRTFNDAIPKPTIRNQVLFVVFGSIFAFTYAAASTDIDTEYWIRRVTSGATGWSRPNITNADLAKIQYFQLGKDLQESLERMKDIYKQIPLLIQVYLTKIHVTIAQTYLDNSEGKRICWKICLLNAAIYAAWKFKRLLPAMDKRFMHHPLSGKSYTLLTSMFSHRNLPHLVLNCMALESFGAAVVHFMSKEQAKQQPLVNESTARYHFLAFYVSAGLFAGLVSHIVSAKFRYPRMIVQLVKSASTTRTATAAAAASAASTAVLPSLGASGAIYACVTLTALGFPETEIALFIPPTFPIPIQWGVGGLLFMDIIGALRGWRVLDHWAHLGGAAFGILYYKYGPGFWADLRAPEEEGSSQ